MASHMDMDIIEAPVSVKAYLMCAFATFAGILFGYDTGYVSSVIGMTSFKKAYGNPSTGTYTTSEKSLIVSILSCGTFFGALISASLADRFGRRTIVITGCIGFAIGVVVQVAIISIPALVVGRLISGFGVGFISAVNIMYLSETAPRNIRGMIVSCYQFSITVGIMLASVVGYATRDRPGYSAFRIPISIQFVWATVLTTGLLFMPESPRYYVKKGKLDKAMKALARVRGQSIESDYVLMELAEIQANYLYEQQLGEVSWLGCFKGGVFNSNSNARKIFIGTSIQMMQQFTGINFIFYYNTTFFQSLHLHNPFLISLITTLVNVASTPLSFYTIERFGRRPLLIWGATSMAVCEFIVAFVGTFLGAGTVQSYVLIIFVCLYVFFFASTWGPAGWVVIGEIFQLPIRSKGVALSTASNWFWNCIIAVLIPYIVDGSNNATVGTGTGGLGVKVFFLWAGLCAVCAVVAYVVVPETKSLTLEQVDRMMEEVSARRSGKWRGREEWARGLSDEANRQATAAQAGIELRGKTAESTVSSAQSPTPN